MDQAAIDAGFAGRDVLYDPALVDQPERLRTAVADCRALIVRNRTQVRGELLKSAGRLKVVGRLGVGLDNIDLAACAASERMIAGTWPRMQLIGRELSGKQAGLVGF